jgi:diadenosine tetraphosphate (Ap4A) HIT family hydrolase
MENAQFGVVPSLGPIVPGHMLICPKEHVTSLRDLLLRDQAEGYTAKQADGLLSMRTALTAALKGIYHQPVHFFEHGCAVGSPNKLCTVDHAHLHAVPTEVSILAMLDADPLWIRLLRSIEDVPYHAPQLEYIYYEAPTGEAFIRYSPEGFESQWMRRAFCDALGDPHTWNWRENLRPDLAHRHYEQVADYRTTQVKSLGFLDAEARPHHGSATNV